MKHHTASIEITQDEDQYQVLVEIHDEPMPRRLRLVAYKEWHIEQLRCPKELLAEALDELCSTYGNLEFNSMGGELREESGCWLEYTFEGKVSELKRHRPTQTIY